jgi:hypothetical protein
MARSLTLFQSTTHCRYRVYTKFLLTYTAIFRRNRKVPPLGITALQPQSHFYLGPPYTNSIWPCHYINELHTNYTENVHNYSPLHSTSINARNKHHLHRPNAKFLVLGKVHYVLALKIFITSPLMLPRLRNEKAQFMVAIRIYLYTLLLLCSLHFIVMMIHNTAYP